MDYWRAYSLLLPPGWEEDAEKLLCHPEKNTLMGIHGIAGRARKYVTH
jgi:hypothetical protein